MAFPLVTLKVPHDLVKVKGDAHALLFPAWDVEAYLERVHPPSSIVCMELLLTHTKHTHYYFYQDYYLLPTTSYY